MNSNIWYAYERGCDLSAIVRALDPDHSGPIFWDIQQADFKKFRKYFECICEMTDPYLIKGWCSSSRDIKLPRFR